MSTERDELAGRFWARVKKSEGCWEWAGSISVYGYGQFQPSRGKNYRAHRLAYELSIGPIPDGLVLDHLCRNRSCVNPDHLEPVASGTNILRGVGPTAQNAAQTHCKQGHPFDSTGSRGERRCTACDNAKTSAWSKEKRQAVVCGAPSRTGEACKMKIALGKKCRNHATTNAREVIA